MKKSEKQKSGAFRHWEDGKQWLRIIEENGNEYDEPIAGWIEVWDLIRGGMVYRHDNTKRQFPAL